MIPSAYVFRNYNETFDWWRRVVWTSAVVRVTVAPLSRSLPLCTVAIPRLLLCAYRGAVGRRSGDRGTTTAKGRTPRDRRDKLTDVIRPGDVSSCAGTRRTGARGRCNNIIIPRESRRPFVLTFGHVEPPREYHTCWRGRRAVVYAAVFNGEGRCCTKN